MKVLQFLLPVGVFVNLVDEDPLPSESEEIGSSLIKALCLNTDMVGRQIEFFVACPRQIGELLEHERGLSGTPGSDNSYEAGIPVDFIPEIAGSSHRN